MNENYYNGVYSNFNGSDPDDLIKNQKVIATIDDDNTSENSTYSSEKITEKYGNFITKSISVSDMSDYLDAKAVPLSEYGLSEEDVEKFAENNLNVSIVLNLLTALISVTAPQVVKNMSDFTKKIINHLYQIRFQTNSSETVIINPIKDVINEAGGISDADFIAGVSVTAYLSAIKYSVISWFDIPRIVLSIPFDTILANLENPTVTNVLVTKNNIIWLSMPGGALKDIGEQYLDRIHSNIDSRFNLPSGTAESIKASDVIQQFYEGSQSEEYISTLDENIQDKVRGCKESIEKLAKWHGYDTVEEFVTILKYLENM